jgi:biopolymer transport protein ExbD
VNFGRARARRSEPQIDLTPMIDAVFLLLIFFLVTASFTDRDDAVVPLDLPEGTTGEGGTASERVDIYVTADGLATVDTGDGAPVENIDGAELDALLRRMQAENPERPVYLRGDREVPYGTVMGLLDTVRRSGFRRVFNVIYQSE